MVERIHQFDTGCVEVRLRLEDGSDAAAVMPLIDAEWLDLRGGDIVVVSPHAARALRANRARVLAERRHVIISTNLVGI